MVEFLTSYAFTWIYITFTDITDIISMLFITYFTVNKIWNNKIDFVASNENVENSFSSKVRTELTWLKKK